MMAWSLFKVRFLFDFFTSWDDSDPTPSESPHQRDPFPCCVLIQSPAWPWPYWKAMHLPELPQLDLWCGTNAWGYHQHSLLVKAEHKKQPYITQALTVLDVPYKAPCNYIHRAESPRNCMKLCLKLLNIVATFSHFIPNLSKSVINNAAQSLRKAIFPENVTSAESVCFRDKVNISEVCEGPPLNRCRTACRFLALT